MLARLHLRTRINCHLLAALTLTLVVLVSSYNQAFAAAAPFRARVLVKLRRSLADDVEAALPLKGMTLLSGQGASPRVQAFFTQHNPRRMAPLYTSIVRTKKLRGLSDRQVADLIRGRFPQRASRLRTMFNPPEISRSYVLEVTASSREELQQTLTRLKADPDVEFAEEDKTVSINFTPNDPYFSSYGTWGQSYDDLWGIKKIGAPSAWDTTAGAGVVVAVVDTGIDYNHPDIAANIWTNTDEIAGNGTDDDGNGYVDDVRGWDFIGNTYRTPTPDNDPTDGYGHGTHVAGTIAAVGNNGLGVIGVAWQAQVMPVKGLDDSGYGLDSTLAPAIIYAANNGAAVISNSWAGHGTSQTIADAVSYAYNLGAVIVAAAGNNNDDARNYYPGNLPQVITVAATDHNDYNAYFSNWGSKVDVAAPGVDILSLRASGTTMGTPVDAYYTRADGTSMATPHVSGLAALVLAAHPQYSNEDVRQAIRASATDLYPSGFDLNYGYGRINASSAVALTSVLEAKILSPTDGTHIKTSTTITGVASGTGFSQYVLEFGAGDLPTNWTLIQSSPTPVANGTLGTFDPRSLPDGKYTIQLVAYDAANHAFVDRMELVVDDVTITAPAPPIVPVTASVYKPGAQVSISGTATGPSFQDFRLQWAEGINPPSGWSSAGMTLTGGGTSPVSNGVIGTWDTSSITVADYYTIRLSVDNSGFTSQAETLVYLEPSLLSSGWPQWLNQAPYFSSGVVPALDASSNWHLTLQNGVYSNTTIPAQFWNFSADGFSENVTQVSWGNLFNPAAADLDGNVGDEVVSGNNNWLDLFRLDNSFYSLSPSIFANYQYSQVVLEDLDGDSEFETIALGTDFSTHTAHVFAWRRDGTQLNSNFPLIVQDQNSNLSYGSGPRVLVGDINGDGKREIVVQEGTSSSTFALRLFSNDGSPKTWNAPVFNGYSDQMALADLDHNGTLETILLCLCNSQKQLHVLQPDGTERAGWPFVLGNTSWSYIAIGDINRDGQEEIVMTNASTIYVLEPDGTSYSAAWPLVGSGWASLGPVVLADVDGDGFPEIVTTRDQYFLSSNPLLPTDAQTKSTPAARSLAIGGQSNSDGTASLQPRVNANTQAYSANSYFQPQLVAFHPDGTVVRSWNLLGANGNQPFYSAKLTVGDFNHDGITDIAAVYFTVTGGGISGFLSEGVATVLTTGAPYNPSANDWPMIYQNPRNTAMLVRDHTPPTVAIASPAAGATVGGQVTLVATATDNVAVTSVQFQLDGFNLGSPDTTAPFTIVWDATQVSPGSHTLTAVASDAAANTAVSAPVNLTVQPPISATVVPATLNFGTQIIGTMSSPQTVTVTNNGSGTLVISAVQIAGDFAQTNNCAGSLAVGANCTIQVSFEPTLRGAESGTLALAGNFTGNAPTVSLGGTGQAQQASFNPSSLNFGGQPMGYVSSPLTISYVNNGDVPTTISGVSTTGDFAQTNNCGASLAAGASCTVSVTFNPTVRGAENGTLSVNGSVNATAGLSGTGLALLATIAPKSLNFGNQLAGTTSAPLLVTITNTGDYPFYINTWSMGGGGFSAVNNCPFTLLLNSSCNFSVTFTPTYSGTYSGTLTIGGNFSGSPAAISLTGTGTATTAVISSTSLTFAGQIVNTTSNASILTLANTGNTPVTISGIQITGDFSQSNNCPSSLAVSGYCQINVSFRPTVSGSRTGSLAVNSNSNPAVSSVSLVGTGLDFSLSATPASVTVNAGKSATYTATVQALGGSYGSSVSLSCSGLPASSSCSFSPSAVTPGSGHANSTMTVSTTARKGSRGTPAGTYTLTISGTSGSLQRTTTVNLTVN